MIIDTHCHLYMEPYETDRAAVVERAIASGVRHLVNVGIDEPTSLASYELSRKFSCLSHTVGFHPHSAHEMNGSVFNGLEKLVRETRPAAIGEIGLDFFKSQADRATQIEVFIKMIGLARTHDLPVIVHSREAQIDTYEVLLSEKIRKGVMHCFSYDWEAARRYIDLGFYISFACNITFKNASALLETAKKVPLERLVVETDSPYLAPQGFRGQRNEPAYLKEMTKFLAEARGIPSEELERKSSENAIALFGLCGVAA